MENNFEKENEQLEAQNEPCEEAVVEIAGETDVEPAGESVESAQEAPKKKFPWWIIAVIGGAIAVIITFVILLIPKNTNYTITVLDEDGVPMSNVIVKLTDAEGMELTRITDKDGVAKFEEMPIGESSVILERGFSDAVILTMEYKLDKNVTELVATVADENKRPFIYGNINDGAYAYIVHEGEHKLDIYEDRISYEPKTLYLIFTPTASGIYNISLASGDTNATVAYHGNPNFVQIGHILDGEYDGKSFEFIVQDTRTPHVIGIDCADFANAVLTIERVADAPFDPNYAEWIEVKATEDFIDVDTGILNPVDLSDSELTVTLGDDGYYYTNYGEIIYLCIGKDAPYIETSIAYIAGYVDKNVGNNFGGYVYDENGNFKAKYSYNSMIESYLDHCDSNGVYPLTTELLEAIKCHGEQVGWWNPTSPNFLFRGVIYNEENPWLFLCCVEL